MPYQISSSFATALLQVLKSLKQWMVPPVLPGCQLECEMSNLVESSCFRDDRGPELLKLLSDKFFELSMHTHQRPKS